ncbi:hypothetical protein HYX70_05170 [Candidatus Saccharibacteria bacterium]|nr:hypothetical protein [Candidatus Saccharibacteria bacterium]
MPAETRSPAKGSESSYKPGTLEDLKSIASANRAENGMSGQERVGLGKDLIKSGAKEMLGGARQASGEFVKAKSEAFTKKASEFRQNLSTSAEFAKGQLTAKGIELKRFMGRTAEQGRNAAERLGSAGKEKYENAKKSVAEKREAIRNKGSEVLQSAKDKAKEAKANLTERGRNILPRLKEAGKNALLAGVGLGAKAGERLRGNAKNAIENIQESYKNLDQKLEARATERSQERQERRARAEIQAEKERVREKAEQQKAQVERMAKEMIAKILEQAADARAKLDKKTETLKGMLANAREMDLSDKFKAGIKAEQAEVAKQGEQLKQDTQERIQGVLERRDQLIKSIEKAAELNKNRLDVMLDNLNKTREKENSQLSQKGNVFKGFMRRSVGLLMRGAARVAESVGRGLRQGAERLSNSGQQQQGAAG